MRRPASPSQGTTSPRGQQPPRPPTPSIIP
jgi:hypothetical protein